MSRRSQRIKAAAAPSQSVSILTLPTDLQSAILSAAVQSLRLDNLHIDAPDEDDNFRQFSGRLRSYYRLRAVCSGWRQLLDALPLPIGEVSMRRSWGFRHLETAPLQISKLSLDLNPEEMPDRYAPLLDSLLSSSTVRRHSGPSLRRIHSLGPFQLLAANAAAFPHLTRLERLAVDGTTAACLPSGLKRLTFEGRSHGRNNDTLDASVLSHLTRLKRLDLFYLSVDLARLPHSISSLELIGCEPGAEFAAALKASPGVSEAEQRAMWRGGSLLLYARVYPLWDEKGQLVVDDGHALQNWEAWDEDSSRTHEYGEPCPNGSEFYLDEDAEGIGPGWSLA